MTVTSCDIVDLRSTRWAREKLLLGLGPACDVTYDLVVTSHMTWL